ncbi:hypothetical protein CBM2634_A100311 [Cupriavidus taiwanensis]|uniref:Uncharacterized protein n=1 Tax=Cupriavidus taiwanensis TaxID=164546 RepID=A0A375IYA7_9BURK|nr:hypothetical protein CBM2634_A100311 [Cupriavidus taiwanensis]
MEALRDDGPVPPPRQPAGPVVIWNLIRTRYSASSRHEGIPKTIRTVPWTRRNDCAGAIGS